MNDNLLKKTTVSNYTDAFMAIKSPLEFIQQCGNLLKKRSDLGDEHGVGMILLGQGYCCLWICDYKKAIANFYRSIDILEQHNDIVGVLLAKMGIGQAYLFLGEFDQIEKINNELEKSVINTDDFIAKCLVRLNIAEYHMKRSGSEITEKYVRQVYRDSLKKKIWYPYTLSCISLGYYHLEKGETSASKEYLEKAIPLIEQYQMFPQFTIYAYYLLFEAIWLENIAGIEPNSNTKNNINRMRELSLCTLEKSTLWPTHYGPAIRTKGLYYAVINDYPSAVKYLDESVAHSSSLGRRYDLGRTFYFYYLFLKQIGKIKEAEAKLKSAHRVFKEIGSEIYIKRTSELLGIKGPHSSETKLQSGNSTHSSVPYRMKLESQNDLETFIQTYLNQIIEKTGSDRGALSIENKQKKIRLKYLHHLNNKELMHILKDTDIDSDDAVLYRKEAIGDGTEFLCYCDKAISGYRYSNDTQLIFDALTTQTAITIENYMLNRKLKEQKKVEHPLTESTEHKLKSVVSYIEENYTTDISREELSARFGINADNLGRFFKMKTNMRIREYTNEMRVRAAKKLLLNTDSKVIDIAFETGFTSLSTFNRAFVKKSGMTPSQFRIKHRL
ncbi:MAG: AraC family transcriptional regulator [Proteobacteria bacterium]|nr:AraC family transcriptional regulator [Pseudomonadota bacterium]